MQYSAICKCDFVSCRNLARTAGMNIFLFYFSPSNCSSSKYISTCNNTKSMGKEPNMAIFKKVIFLLGLYSSSQTAITKYSRASGLNNRNLFFHHSGGWEAQEQGSSSMVDFQWQLPSWLTSSYLLTVSSRGRERNSKLSGVSSYKDMNSSMKAPASWPYVTLTSPIKAPSLSIITLGLLGLPHMNFGDIQTFSP